MKRSLKTVLLILLDSILIPTSYYIAIFIRFEGNIKVNIDKPTITFFFSLIAIKVLVFFVLGLYKNLWKYAGTNELLQVVLGTL